MPRNSAMASARALPEFSSRESDPNYVGVVVNLSDRRRVVICKDNVQWILQQRCSSKVSATERWQAESYVRTREALIRLLQCSIAEIDPSALATLGNLPDRLS